VWLGPDGVPRRLETRSAHGVTRMDLSAIQTTPPPDDALFTFSR
jgi:hypothetical protein